MSIDLRRLDALAAERTNANAEAEASHRAVLNELIRILEAGGDLINVRELARRAGVHHATIYNELGRRQALRDTLTAGNGVPAPAPADSELETRLMLLMRGARRRRATLDRLAGGRDGRVAVGEALRRLIDAGLVYYNAKPSAAYGLTKAGEELVAEARR